MRDPVSLPAFQRTNEIFFAALASGSHLMLLGFDEVISSMLTERQRE